MCVWLCYVSFWNAIALSHHNFSQRVRMRAHVCECQWILTVVFCISNGLSIVSIGRANRVWEIHIFHYVHCTFHSMKACRCITRHPVMPNFSLHFLFINACRPLFGRIFIQKKRLFMDAERNMLNIFIMTMRVFDSILSMIVLSVWVLWRML